MANSEALQELNHLLERNRETEMSYLKALELLQNPELKEHFAVFAHQRFAFGLDLKRSIMDFGKPDSFRNRFAKKLHSRWIRILGLLKKNPDKTIIDTFIIGEERALDDYETIIEYGKISEPTLHILKRHKQSILKIVDNLRLLRNQLLAIS